MICEYSFRVAQFCCTLVARDTDGRTSMAVWKSGRRSRSIRSSSRFPVRLVLLCLKCSLFNAFEVSMRPSPRLYRTQLVPLKEIALYPATKACIVYFVGRSSLANVINLRAVLMTDGRSAVRRARRSPATHFRRATRTPHFCFRCSVVI